MYNAHLFYNNMPLEFENGSVNDLPIILNGSGSWKTFEFLSNITNGMELSESVSPIHDHVITIISCTSHG